MKYNRGKRQIHDRHLDHRLPVRHFFNNRLFELYFPLIHASIPVDKHYIFKTNLSLNVVNLLVFISQNVKFILGVIFTNLFN